MSIKKISKEQPSDFKFDNKNLETAQKIIKNYPEGKQQSAVMALLYLAQKQNNNWIPLVAMKYIAKFLSMPYIKVYEVATFYTMYNLSPVGKHFFQICTTTPCLIRGAHDIVKVCKEKISNKENEYMYWSPFVSHHKPKLQINIITGKWHCWVSNMGGHNLFQLFKKLSATQEQFRELRGIVDETSYGYEKIGRAHV